MMHNQKAIWCIFAWFAVQISAEEDGLLVPETQHHESNPQEPISISVLADQISDLQKRIKTIETSCACADSPDHVCSVALYIMFTYLNFDRITK